MWKGEWDMSTNKTERYGLHRWEPGDDFLREEFNENFAAIDGGMIKMVTGTYKGDGTQDRFIELGFMPQVLMLFTEDGRCTYNSSRYGGMVFPEYPTHVGSNELVRLEGTGFWIHYRPNSYVFSNDSSKIFYYLALY